MRLPNVFLSLRTIACGFWLLFCLVSAVSVRAQQLPTASAFPPIKLLDPIKSSVPAGETRTYSLYLQSREFAVFVLEQQGFDANIAFIDAKTEKKLFEVGFNNDDFGFEQAVFQNGSEPRVLLVRVGASSKDDEKPVKSGDFSLTLAELKTTEARDELRLAAQTSILDGLRETNNETGESSRQARPHYLDALKNSRGAGDSFAESRALSFLQRNANETADFGKSVEYGRAALGLYERQENAFEQALTQHSLGFSYASMGELNSALESFFQALKVWRKIGDHKSEMTTLSMLSYVYQRVGDSEKAVEYRELAYRAAQQAGGNSEKLILGLLNLSEAHFERGDFNKCLEVSSQAVALARKSGEKRLVANGDGVLSRCAMRLGRKQKALDYLQDAFAINHEIGWSKPNEATALNNLANIYLSLGQNNRALDYSRRAAQIYAGLDYRDGVFKNLLTTGQIYLSMKNYEPAREVFTKALTLAETGNFQSGKALILQNLGVIEMTSDRPAQALTFFQQALKLRRELKRKYEEADSLNAISDAYRQLRQYAEAESAGAQALVSARAVGDRDAESNALFRLARARRAVGDAGGALELIEDSIKIIESLRLELTGKESRAAYFSTVRDKYDFYIELLLEQKNKDGGYERGAAAFAASERARARNLLELLAESNTDVSAGVTPELKTREQSIEAKLSASQTQLIRLKSAETPNAALIAKLKAEIEKTDGERELLESEIRQKNPRYAALKYPTTLDLKQTQNLLDEKTVLLEYQIGADASFLFAVGKNEFQIVRLPNETVLRRSVEMLRQSIAAPSRTKFSNYLVTGRELYQTLLAPVENLLKNKTKIIVAADGALCYLPFEVLLTNDTKTEAGKLPFLVRGFEISYTPSASVLANLKSSSGETSKPQRAFLAFAAPDYGFKTAVQNSASILKASALRENTRGQLTDLKNAETEAVRIAALFPAGQATVFTGTQATEERAKTGELLSCYRYLHFAVHGLIDEQQPQFSSLVLSLPPADQKTADKNSLSAEDGLLQTPEIFNLRLQADLVTLSACETGLGQEMSGEGIVGLTRAFFYAGTPSLLVSLWKVDDASTSELMVNFYTSLQKNDERGKASALREAKLKLIAGNQYAHPFYWAAFILQGRSE